MKKQEITVARLTNEMDVLKQDLIVQQRHKDTKRIVLIGCTRAGKSSLGNTLLGVNCFDTHTSFKSCTLKCEIAESMVGKRRITVADTPPIINSDGENMTSALALFFDLLAPGPHAIIIVIAPYRHTDIEEQSLELLFDFFGDDHFLDFTMLVMVRKSDTIGEYGESNNMYDYIKHNSPESIKQLYEKCNKRIVAVENRQTMSDRQQDAENVLKEIDKLDGYYSQRYFQKLSDEKSRKNRSNCKQM